MKHTNDCDCIGCVAPMPSELKDKVSEYTTTRHNISLKFETFGPDAIAPLTWSARDLVDLITQPYTTPVVVKHQVTTVHILRREFTLQK